MNTTIFLGAGASASEGAPLQNQLFKKYFQSRKKNDFYVGDEGELNTFFHLMFGTDAYNTNSDFPTFEEILGLIDIAIKRGETFRNYDLENIAANSGNLRTIRRQFIQLLSEVIHESLLESKEIHSKLICKLVNANIIDRVNFISTNYDILIDNALMNGYAPKGGSSIDYGIDFSNFELDGNWSYPSNRAVKLYKVHGSLNWLYCPSCNTIKLTPGEKGVIKIKYDPSKATCRVCESVLTPIIIPPTFFKEMTNVFVNQIWYRAEQDLRKSDHVIFCGYSFPDADLHIKYLLKRRQVNSRDYMPLKFTVINNYPGKPKEVKDYEFERYVRFLGGNLNYTDLSFEDFAENPEVIINAV